MSMNELSKQLRVLRRERQHGMKIDDSSSFPFPDMIQRLIYFELFYIEPYGPGGH